MLRVTAPVKWSFRWSIRMACRFLGVCCLVLFLYAVTYTGAGFTRRPHVVADRPPELWSAHPRLIVSAKDWSALESRRAADPRLDKLVRALFINAHDLLEVPLLERTFTGRRLLFVSRSFVKRILLWSFAYRLSGQDSFLHRAREEMLNVAAFVDWNPHHFLDVAEMAAGFALAFDWLYDGLTAADRKTLREALVRHALEHARNGHHTFKKENNWAQVCMGGMVLGALAVGDEEPELAASLLAAARKDAPRTASLYASDGNYAEGPWYWVYGTTYEVLLVSSLRSVLGNDWDLTKELGFYRSAEFYVQTVGPTGLHYNFSDSTETAPLAPPLFFLAREQSRPELLEPLLRFADELESRRERVSDLYTPLVVFWWPTLTDRVRRRPLPLHYMGSGANPLAIWRSSWKDSGALYFAIKGGGAPVPHGHMDAGSFVLDLDGVRWAVDLGRQDYESLESQNVTLWNSRQGSQRWMVFRIGNHAHNTLTIDATLHNASGAAEMASAGANGVNIDMSAVFLDGQAMSSNRIAHVCGETVILKDRIVGARPGTQVSWVMLTYANVTVQGTEVLLTSEGKALQVTFIGKNIGVQVEDAAAPRSTFDAPNPGLQRLLAHSRADDAGNWKLDVLLARPSRNALK
jgi:oligo-alginate lyase